VALARVQISEDKAELVKALRASDDTTGPFQTYADVLTFAAALGFKRNRRSPLGKFSRKDPDAVLQEQFKNGSIIHLIAIIETQDPKVLTNTDECDLARVQIFQEYVNGGLEILQSELNGVVDYSEQILLMLNLAKEQPETKEFDLTKFL
jgi:dnd system-associated protein 4